MGDFRVVGPVVTYGQAENRIRSLPPTLGEHTHYILKNIVDLSDKEVDSLYANKTVQ